MVFFSYKLSDPNKHTLKTLEFMYLCWYIFVDFFLFANRGYDYMHFRIKNSGTENHNSCTYALWVYFTKSFIKNQFKNALISRWYWFNWLIYNKKKSNVYIPIHVLWYRPRKDYSYSWTLWKYKHIACISFSKHPVDLNKEKVNLK